MKFLKPMVFETANTGSKQNMKTDKAVKIIQISDTHLVPNKVEMHGICPSERLTACVKSICREHADAELCVVTGDLAHQGEIPAYETLLEILSHLPMPYHLMVGNHDKRENLLSVFPTTPSDENGFVQSVIDVEAGRLILLDTVESGKKFGSFCHLRADWLTEQLQQEPDRPTYLFLHHPPFEIGIPYMDRMRLLQGDDLLASTISSFKNIRHIFFGHVHRPIAGNWKGISVSSFRGTAHQVALRADETEALVRSHESPAYGVILLSKDSTIVHFHDFLDDTAFVAVNETVRIPPPPLPQH